MIVVTVVDVVEEDIAEDELAILGRLPNKEIRGQIQVTLG